jgi:MFS family permease
MVSSEVVTSPRAAFRNRDFRLYQFVRLFSIVAFEMQSVAVGWQIYQITHRALDLGYVGLAQFLPGVLLFLIAGHTADRFDRRRVLLVCNSAYAGCSVLLLLNAHIARHGVATIYVIIVVLGVVRAFSGPASQSLMPQLVPAEHFPNAVAWNSAIFQAATILGPAIGGVIYGWSGKAQTVYASSTVMYLGAATAVALMKVRTGRMEHRAASIETLFAGFRYVWEHREILGSISLDLFAVLFGGAVALLPIYAREILHIGPWGLGMLRSTPAIGSGIMGVWLAYRPLRRKAGIIMFYCVALFGVATIVFGTSRSVLLSLLALFVIGAADMVSIFVRSTLVQVATPPAMRGRVSAVNLLFVGASNQLGEFESGITAHWFGTVPSVVYGGIGTLIVVALWAWMFPELRRVERLTITEPVMPDRANPESELSPAT